MSQVQQAEVGIQVARPGGAAWEDAARFHHDRYVALGWIHPHPTGRVVAYDGWREDAAFHVARNDAGRVVGVLRTILGAFRELPVGRVEPDPSPEPPGLVVEFASLVARPGRAGQAATLPLYRSGVRWALANQADGVVALLDQWLIERLAARVGAHFEPLGPPRAYLGTSPRAVGVPMGRLIAGLKAASPAFWSDVPEPAGLTGSASS